MSDVSEGIPRNRFFQCAICSAFQQGFFYCKYDKRRIRVCMKKFKKEVFNLKDLNEIKKHIYICGCIRKL